MKIQFKSAKHIDGVHHFKKGVNEVADSLKDHWYLKALIKSGEATVVPAPAVQAVNPAALAQAQAAAKVLADAKAKADADAAAKAQADAEVETVDEADLSDEELEAATAPAAQVVGSKPAPKPQPVKAPQSKKAG